MLGKNECHETYFRIDSLGSPLATCLRFSFVKTDLGLCSISFETYAERPQIWPGLVVNDLRFALNLSWKTWDMVGTRHQWLKFSILDLKDLRFYLDWCQIRHWLVMNDLCLTCLKWLEFWDNQDLDLTLRGWLGACSWHVPNDLEPSLTSWVLGLALNYVIWRWLVSSLAPRIWLSWVTLVSDLFLLTYPK